MTHNCVFCLILKGDLPSSKVYEDEDIFAIMDIKPVNQGHILVIPKEHQQFMSNVNENAAQKMFPIAQKINSSLRKLAQDDPSFKLEGVNLFLADGESAGQEVFHSHLHVIPRYKKDGFKLKVNYPKSPDRDGLNEFANKLTKYI